MVVTDIVDYLQSIPNLYVNSSSSISYIKKIVGKSENVVFVCKKITDPILSPTNDNNENISFNSDLNNESGCGSPLKDICEIDNMANMTIHLDLLTSADPNFGIEQNYNSIPLSEARKILNEINFNENLKESITPIWILASDESENSILLEVTKKINYNSRGVVNYTGFTDIKTLNINNLIHQHFLLIPNTNQVETEIDTYFKLSDKITLKLQQKYHTAEIPFTTYNNSEMIVYQTVQLNNDESPLNHLWTQLILLNKLKDHIVQCMDKDEEPSSAYQFESQIEFDDIKQQIVKILNLNYIYFDESESNETANNRTDLSVVILKTKNRNYIDLTDHLFDILKCCSYQKLKTALMFIFQCAAKQTILNLPTNTNRLAKLINEISQQRIGIPHLTNFDIYQMLLEIGFEKLTKEYEIIFTDGKICNINELKFVNETMATKKGGGKKGVSDVNAERRTLLHSKYTRNLMEDDFNFTENTNITLIEKKLYELSQIHLIIEHLLILQMEMKLNNFHISIIQQLLQRKTYPFEKLLLMKMDKVELTLFDKNVLSDLSKHEISEKRIKMYSENKFKNVSNTFYYSLAPIMPIKNLPLAVQLKLDEMNDLQEINKYISLHYIKIDMKK